MGNNIYNITKLTARVNFWYQEKYCQKYCKKNTVNTMKTVNPVFDGVGLAGFKSRTNASLLAEAALSQL